MKKLLIIFTFCFISHSAFADKLQGNFYCKDKYPDGSGGKFTLKINGPTMITKDVGYDFNTEYKEVFFSEKKGYSIYVPTKNLGLAIYVIAPTEQNNRITLTKIDNENYYTKSVIAHGTCDRV